MSTNNDAKKPCDSENVEFLFPAGFDEEKYWKAVSVNGSPYYENNWSLKKKILTLPFFIWNVVEARIFQVLILLIRPFLPKSHIYRKDPRKWPVSKWLYEPAKGVTFLKHNATTWMAIEYLYTWNENVKNFKGYGGMLDSLLGSVENILATRNRFRSLKKELLVAVNKYLKSDKVDIRFLSLAAGSCRGILEVIEYFLSIDESILNRITIHLVDDDPAAYEFAKELADKIHPKLKYHIIYHQMRISAKPGKVEEFEQLLRSVNPDVVEMVGFTDYMTEEKAIKIMSIIYDSLTQDGIFITNNVKPNDEQYFLEVVVTWTMLNRSEEAMTNILKSAGFPYTRIVNEPTNIQPVYVSQKVRVK